MSEFEPITNAADLVMPPRETQQSFTSSCVTSKDLCSCKYNDGLPCFPLFERTVLEDTRAQYVGMQQSERDITILANIENGIHSSDTTQSAKKEQKQRHYVIMTDFICFVCSQFLFFIM